PEIVLAAPGVGDGLRTGAAVDIEKHGIARRGIETRRLDEPRIELDAAADVDLTELGRAESQAGDFRLERRVVHERADQVVIRQTNERCRRRNAETRVHVNSVPTAR